MPDIPERIIRPQRGLIGIDFHELWRYRELFFFLAWRDILIRYKQTLLGVIWAILQPLGNVVVFTVIFGKVAKLSSNGVPYPLITLAALIPWQLFANATSQSTNAVVGSAHVISKVYFPRLILPLSSTLSAVLDAFIAFAMMVLVMIGYVVADKMGYIELNGALQFYRQMLFLPLFFLLALLAALAVGLWLSALNVKYRDVKYVVPYLIRIGILVTPVGYLSSVISEEYRFLYSLNPLVGVIDGFRWCLLGPTFEPYWPGLWLSLGITFVFFVTGAVFFRNTERRFADLI